jgi:hypothetical protein
LPYLVGENGYAWRTLFHTASRRASPWSRAASPVRQPLPPDPAGNRGGVKIRGGSRTRGAAGAQGLRPPQRLARGHRGATRPGAGAAAAQRRSSVLSRPPSGRDVNSAGAAAAALALARCAGTPGPSWSPGSRAAGAVGHVGWGGQPAALNARKRVSKRCGSNCIFKEVVRSPCIRGPRVRGPSGSPR